MRNNVKKMIYALALGSGAWDASAGVIYPMTQPTWSDGTLAASCSFTYPTLQPLSRQRNLIVENELPNGSVLYSWGYDNFAPDFYSVCNGVAEYTTTSQSGYPELRIIDRLDFNNLNNNLLTGEWLWETNNPGVALKLYIILTARGDKNTGYTNVENSRSTYVSNAFNPILTGQEIAVTPYIGTVSIIDGTMNSILSDNKSGIVGSAHYFKYSVRGELIKVGDIQTGIPLSLASSATIAHSFFMNNTNSSQHGNIGFSDISPNTIFGSGGITFVKPSCRLRGGGDYLVELRKWDNKTNLPAYGDIELIDINIECNGTVNNVEFSFQDTGYVSSDNHNISLYDSIGGQSIEGLEIEMFYSGSRLNIHRVGEAVTTYKTNIGSHGSIKTDTSDLNFNSQSQAQFGARIVQQGAISRAGNMYTGPVTGKVNMFMTYY